MAECAIALALNTDFIKVANDKQVAMPVADGDEFAKAIAEFLVASQTLPQDLFQSFPHVLSVNESVSVPEINLLNNDVMELYADILNTPSQQDGDVIETVECDPVIGLATIDVPSMPVLKMLKAEFTSEDFKLYAPPIQAKIEDAQEVKKVEKVTFIPGAQSQIKMDATPKFTEIIQQVKPLVLVSELPIIESNDNGEVIIPVQESDEDGVFDNSKMPQDQTVVKTAVPIQKSDQDNLFDKSQRPQDQIVIKTAVKIEKESKIDFTTTSQTQSVVDKQPINLVSEILSSSPKAQKVAQDVAVHLKHAIDTGMDKVTIKLNPQSLGRIEIELHFAKDGRVNAILFADKIETHDLLQRNPQLLKESLAGAGVSPDSTDISFNFRGENQGSEHQRMQKNKTNHVAVVDGVGEPASYRQSSLINSTKKVDIHA